VQLHVGANDELPFLDDRITKGVHMSTKSIWMMLVMVGLAGVAGSALAELPESNAKSDAASEALAGSLARMTALEDANRELDARLKRLSLDLDQEKARALQSVENHVHEYQRERGGFMRLVDIPRNCADCLIRVMSPDDQQRPAVDTTSGPIF
jgi:hypothetical protein